MELSELIKKIREEKNLSLGRLSEISGISKATLSLWERGVNPNHPNKPLVPTIANLQKLAKALDFDLDRLVSLLDDDSRIEIPSPSTSSEIASSFNDDGSNVAVDEDFMQSDTVKIPVYGCVPAGVPLEAIEDIDGYADIPASWVGHGQFIGLTVSGSSMYPKYLEGDTVVIKLQDHAVSGQDAVVYVNGYDATLKTVINEPDGSTTLKPINPEYQTKTYKPGVVRVLGIVKRMIREL